jgi:putative heme-binding domain-containing protein
MAYVMRLGTCHTLALAFASLTAAQQDNPFTSEQDVAMGARLYQTHCSYCHGAQGEGGRGPDLTVGRFRHGGSDAELFNTIRNGIRGTEMPQVRATDDEVWRMVAFVKKLSANPSAAERGTASGNVETGRAVFGGKGKCLSCHAVGRAGGSIGPDLTGVGRRRAVAYLREALVKPETEIAIVFRAVRVTTRSGQTVAGIRLNEDDISIQLRDTTDTPRSFLKANLRGIERDKPALMPSYSSRLSASEIEDVVAYLNSLQEALQ